MVYFVAKVVPFVAKGGPVLIAKDGTLPVAEIGILYLTIYKCNFTANQNSKSKTKNIIVSERIFQKYFLLVK